MNVKVKRRLGVRVKFGDKSFESCTKSCFRTFGALGKKHTTIVYGKKGSLKAQRIGHENLGVNKSR